MPTRWQPRQMRDGRWWAIATLLVLLCVLLAYTVWSGSKKVAPGPSEPTSQAVAGADSSPTAGKAISSPAAEKATSSPPVGKAESSPTDPKGIDIELEARMKMVETQIRRRGVTDQDVLRAMEAVARHEFVPDQYEAQAYADHPLPIGHGQTISQPYIVALMTELLSLTTTDRVLEIGTGSGYQAAILAEIVADVYTIEIVEPLAVEASERLERLGYANIHTLHADGYYGWEEHAPFDAIIVTAAPDHIPQPLVQQLVDGGKLVIPVGPPGGYQTLWEITKQGESVKKRNVTGVLFVPLTGER